MNIFATFSYFLPHYIPALENGYFDGDEEVTQLRAGRSE
jgi:hypothetical protein